MSLPALHQLDTRIVAADHKTRLQQVLTAGRNEAKRKKDGFDDSLLIDEALRSIIVSFLATPTPSNLRKTCVDVARFCSGVAKATQCSEADWKNACYSVPFNTALKQGGMSFKAFFVQECSIVTKPIPKDIATLPQELVSRPSTMQARAVAIGALVRGHAQLYEKLKTGMRVYTNHGELSKSLAFKLIRSVGPWYEVDGEAIGDAEVYLATH